MFGSSYLHIMGLDVCAHKNLYNKTALDELPVCAALHLWCNN